MAAAWPYCVKRNAGRQACSEISALRPVTLVST